VLTAAEQHLVKTLPSEKGGPSQAGAKPFDRDRPANDGINGRDDYRVKVVSFIMTSAH